MKTYYLQLDSPEAFQRAEPVAGLCLRIIDPPDGAVNQRFYREVGGPWEWTQCADWSAQRWDEYLQGRPISTVVLEKDGEEIGYAELINRDGDLEILSFGLLPAFVGKGLGSASLDLVVHYAWTLGGVHHVWLHTCEKDHPNALRNYRQSGFVIYDVKSSDVPNSRESAGDP